MARERAHANAYGYALVSLAGAALVVILPSLLITPDAAGSVAALALVLLGLAASVRLGLCIVDHARSAQPPPRGAPVPVLSGRVTDPVHHPLRPRAPGLA